MEQIAEVIVIVAVVLRAGVEVLACRLGVVAGFIFKIGRVQADHAEIVVVLEDID